MLRTVVGDLSVKLHSSDKRYFKEGSPEKIALHAAVGAAVAAAAGNNIGTGAAAGGVSELVNGVLQKVLATKPDLSEAQKATITQWVAAAVGVAVGGKAGAAAGLDNVKYNFLTHKQRDELEESLKSCSARGDVAVCKETVSKQYKDIDFNQEKKLNACRTVKCVTDLIGDLKNNWQLSYNKVTQLQELGADTALVQRLFAYQVRNNSFELRALSALAGASYCDAHGGAKGCYAKGTMLQYGQDSAIDALAVLLGEGIGKAATKIFGPVLRKVITQQARRTEVEVAKAAGQGGEAGGSVALTRGTQIALNKQNGTAFENQVVDALSHLGGTKNGVPVTVTLPSGKQVTTIPDLWGRNTGGILEVKNVQNLSNSNQLRAQLQLAEETGTPFNLVVSPRTQNISGPLRDRIDEVTSKVGGGIYRYDPSTGDLSNF